MGIGLDRCFFANVRIRNRKLGVLSGFHEFLVDVFDLDLILGRRVGDCLKSTWFTSPGFLVRSGIAGILLPLLTLLLLKSAESIKLLIPVPLVFI